LNRRVRWTLATLIAVVAAAVLAACGNSEPKHTPVTPASDFSSPEDGIAFRAPKAATVEKGKDEQVVVLRRGESTLTISRFPRPGEKLPDSEKQYKRAAKVLQQKYLEQLKEPAIAGFNSLVHTYTGHRAVRVILTPNREKSTDHIHFYEYGAEVVIDLSAPKGDWMKAERTLMDPVVESLKITKPQD
jgi:hypothetical protein